MTIRYSLDPSVNKKRITEGKEEIRRVDIDLREAGMPTSTATLLMRVNHLLASELQVGERVPVISRNDSVRFSLRLISTRLPNLPLESFPLFPVSFLCAKVL